MKFITTKTETSLSDLTRQVFDLQGAKTDAATKQAQAALRKANPHLGDRASLPAGTLVLVPDVPGVSAAPLQSLTGVGPEVAAQLKQALAGAKAVLTRSVASETQDAEASVSLVKSRELIKFVKQAPELQQRLPRIADQAKLQVKQIEAAKAAQLEGLAQLAKDLGSLTG